ncbi:unnamed protein product [Heligmosomoides polygyrus]|uniref:Cell cycle checkpoint protein RAD17 n=1 Tax=Heligmosomoides polygyrus TaxID=6339 RepID=A0A183F4Y5_HELPZ|nr:unnamed protein product [Heligmosomoides polygyrus]
MLAQCSPYTGAWSKPLPEACDLFFVAASPRKPDDLSVNPRQLNKLKALLNKDEGRGRILLVTGPAGCGKSSSIDVIAKSLKFEVLKWERSANVEVAHYADNNYLKEDSELNSLVAFLRSCTLPAKTKRKAAKITLGRVYHIDELPHSAYQDVGEFRRVILPYLQNNKNTIIFDLTSRDSSWFTSPKRVFPKFFINGLRIFELEFYPVASTFMRKALRRVVACMGFKSRLFHMLGSLLYAKRVSEGSDFPEQELTVRGDLRRPSPKREVNDILLMSKASADTVMMFLHEHEPNFSGSIANTRKVLDAMSMSDAMSSVWETRQISQEYSSQVCARATMFYNYRANRVARGFYSYSRPKWYPLSEKTTELQKEVREVMCCSASSQRHCADMDVTYLSLLKSSLTGSQYRLVTYLTRPWKFSWSTDRGLWDHQIASDPSYRMAQFRENTSSRSISSEVEGDSDEEAFVIEDSEEGDQSDDSFDEPVVLL